MHNLRATIAKVRINDEDLDFDQAITDYRGHGLSCTGSIDSGKLTVTIDMNESLGDPITITEPVTEVEVIANYEADPDNHSKPAQRATTGIVTLSIPANAELVLRPEVQPDLSTVTLLLRKEQPPARKDTLGRFRFILVQEDATPGSPLIGHWVGLNWFPVKKTPSYDDVALVIPVPEDGGGEFGPMGIMMASTAPLMESAPSADDVEKTP